MRAHRLAALLVLVVSAGAVRGGGASSDFVRLTDVRLAMDDGVALVADVYVPTVADGPDSDALYPCVVELTPYRKEARYGEGASYLPGAGVALIEVDARGTGGSEGEYDIVFSVREQADAVAWIDWAAERATRDGQPLAADGSNKLCETEVGMYGGSYSGIIQYLVATLPQTKQGNLPAASPHLAAIAPQRAYGDLYRDIVYHGGMVIGSFGLIWSTGTSAFYLQPPTHVGTPEGQQAWRDHLIKNDPMMVPYLSNPYADARFTSDDSRPAWSQRLYEDASALPRIENLTVPALHLAGWFDSFTRGQLLTFQRAHELERAAAPGARGPNFLIVGPWNHGDTHFIRPEQGFREHLGEWYRYWLEGRAAGDAPPGWIANGFDGNGARIAYFQMARGVVNADDVSKGDGRWAAASVWPPPSASVERLYLRAGGLLSEAAPPGSEAPDRYLYNPTAGTAEILSRWDNAAGTPQPGWDQRSDGPKGLTYQTDPLAGPLEVAGPIALRLWASTEGAPGDPALAGTWPGLAQSAPPYHDTDWVVKLSDVGLDGTATLITAGYLRASHRRFDPARSVTLGGEVLAPFHLHTLEALDPPRPGDVLEYLVEIWPTAKTFPAGHRIRIDVYSADTPNHIGLLKPALNTVFHSADLASYLTLPVLR